MLNDIFKGISSLVNQTKIRSIITAIAARVVASNGAPPAPPAPAPAYNGKVFSSFGVVELTSAVTTSIVVAISDNLVKGNAHDPTVDAVTLATSSTAANVAAEAAAWWQTFWRKTSVSLPSSPLVERFWYVSAHHAHC